MLASSNHVERKKDERNPLNLVLIMEVDESSPVIDVDEITSPICANWRSYTISPYPRI
jgi:hypothetical protein